MGFSIFRFSQINVERRNHHRIKLSFPRYLSGQTAKRQPIA